MDAADDSVSRSRSVPAHAERDVLRVLAARGLRAFGDGFVSLLLPRYLIELGFGPIEVGAIATATLLGSGALTLAVGTSVRRFGQRSLLIAASVLMAATGLAFAFAHGFWPLFAIAVIGTLNPSSGDVSVFLPLEHSVLSRVSDRKRTAVFARYSLAGAIAAAGGSFAAALPQAVASSAGLPLLEAIQLMFVVYAAIGVAVAAIYRPMRDAPGSGSAAHAAPLGPSKRLVYALAALFSVDALAGGLIVQSMLALWLFERFDLSLAAAGALFFWAGVLSAASYLVAVRIAARVGLVNTMVFTHLPSSVCLIAMPFAANLSTVIVLLLVRAALSQMDVPTRSSYVMAIVTPEERPAAASVTAVPRSLASAASPFAAGWLLALSPFGWPLVVAGALKIAYDLMLLAFFGKVRPPEEAPPGARRR